MPACFNLVTINAEISHPHRARRLPRSWRISNNEGGILIETRQRDVRAVVKQGQVVEGTLKLSTNQLVAV